MPPWVVVGVVYHEMLHHQLGACDRDGRRMVHTRQFREREKRFVHHARTEVWETKNLGWLIEQVKPYDLEPIVVGDNALEFYTLGDYATADLTWYATTGR